MAFLLSPKTGPTSYSVTVSLTNPTSPRDFRLGDICASPDGSTDSSGLRPKYTLGDKLADFASATDSATVSVDPESYGIVVELGGAATQPPISASNITCTGGVSYIGSLMYVGATGSLFNVTGDGTITINGADYSD